MDDPGALIERGHAALREWIARDPALAEEFRASAPEFFGAGGAPTGADALLAERRHLEWFVLERESAVLGGLPLQVFADDPEAEERGFGPAEAAAWIGSIAGVFEVTETRPGEGIWLRDLSGPGEYPLVEPVASQVLQAGDMLAGRIFAAGDSVFWASPATAYLRDARLLEAMRADFARARERRRGIVRVAQSEIEGLFHASRELPGAGDAVQRLRALLEPAGVAASEVETILGVLAAEPYEPDPLAPDATGLVAGILDHLAFETDVDLEAARKALLAAWEHLSTNGPGSGKTLRPQPPRAAVAPPPDPDRVAEALAEFDRAREKGLPLEVSFAALERALDLPVDDDSDEDSTAPDFPGAVAAIIEEFLWEMGVAEGAEAAHSYACLRSLGRFAEPLGVLDNLDRRALGDYAARWSLDHDELRSAGEAQVLLAALERFRRWAEETQAITLDEGLEGLIEQLGRDLPRLAEANQRRTRRTDPGEGTVFEIQSVERDVLELRSGDELVSLAVDPLITPWLRPGDILRGRESQGRLAVYACYPCLARELETQD